jgi:hypothetical protein
MIAYSYRSGHIEFTTDQSIPNGALPIAAHPDEDFLRETVAGMCRMSYPTEPGFHDEKPLVPGVPEAADDWAALEAHNKFCQRVKAVLDSCKFRVYSRDSRAKNL